MTTAEHTPFSAARRGYDRTQVDAQLDVLSAQLRAATSARHSALAQVEALSRKLEAGIGDIQSARAVSTQHRPRPTNGTDRSPHCQRSRTPSTG